jgi:hypothetical protein
MNKTLRTAAIALVVLVATARPALAEGFTLELTAPPAVVGQPMVMYAHGTIDVDELAFPYWFSLNAIPTSVTTTCPADRWQGVQFANATGSVVVLSQRETPDAVGRFTIPVAITPTAPGTVLLCGYTDDGLTNTLATASLLLDIAPKPWVQLRSDVRGCRGSQRCRRRAVRRARAACGHDAVCLRKVRRVAS